MTENRQPTWRQKLKQSYSARPITWLSGVALTSLALGFAGGMEINTPSHPQGMLEQQEKMPHGHRPPRDSQGQLFSGGQAPQQQSPNTSSQDGQTSPTTSSSEANTSS